MPFKSISVLPLACWVFAAVPAWSQAPLPPSAKIRIHTGGTVPGNHPWALTINPGQIGGSDNALVTTSISPDYVPGLGSGYVADGFASLKPGKQYTFSLSAAYGGGWFANDLSFGYYGVQFFNVNDSASGNYPNWVADLNNPSLGSFQPNPGVVVTPASLPSLRWTYTVAPWIRANIEDNSLSTPISTYVDYNQVVDANKKMPLSVDYLVWSVPGAKVSTFTSSRNTARGTVDKFTGINNVADGTGLLKITLNTVTYHTDPITISSKVGADKNISIDVKSPAASILPAKCRSPYTCSIYYTPKQEGFTAADGFNAKMKSLPGLNFQVETSFKKAVTKEGYGRLRNPDPANGNKYLAYDSKNDTYFTAATPVGNFSNALVPKSSCAINPGEFPSKTKIITNSPDVLKNAGSKNWIVSDSGLLEISYYQIDLYYGEDLPKIGHIFEPRSVDNALITGVPIIITDLP